MMNTSNLSGQYEVLNPWAEADPVPLRGISPRIADLKGKKVGLFAFITKISSRPIMTVVERKLRERFPSLEFRWFLADHGVHEEIIETKDKGRFEEWAREIDAAVAAVGD